MDYTEKEASIGQRRKGTTEMRTGKETGEKSELRQDYIFVV